MLEPIVVSFTIAGNGGEGEIEGLGIRDWGLGTG
jgi:hypothetical protein